MIETATSALLSLRKDSITYFFLKSVQPQGTEEKIECDLSSLPLLQMEEPSALI